MTLREQAKVNRILLMGALSLVMMVTGCRVGGSDGDGPAGVAPFTITLNNVTPVTGMNNRQILAIDFTLEGVTDQQFQLLLQYFFDDDNDQMLGEDETLLTLTPATQQQLMDAGIDATGYFDPSTDTMFDSGTSTQTGTFFWCVNSDLPFGGNVCLLLDALNVQTDQMVEQALQCNVSAPAGLPTTSTSGDANAAAGPATGSGFSGLFGHTAVNLFGASGDGIVIAGGTTENTAGVRSGVDAIEDLAFDVTNLIHSTNSGPFTMASSREFHASAFFYSGTTQQVLVVGGSPGTGIPAATASSDIFSNGTVTPGPTMNQARINHTATWLPNNTILVAGGLGGPAAATTAEIYDPALNQFTPIAFPMPNPRHRHTACLLPDGRVMLAGGLDPTTQNPIVADFFDLQAFLNGQNPWSSDTTGGVIDRSDHTATLLVNGVCYLVGGRSVTNPGSMLDSAHAYRPFAMTVDGIGTFPAGFSPSQDTMNQARSNHATTRLGSGELFITGGQANISGSAIAPQGVTTFAVMSTEAFLPVCFTDNGTGTFTPMSGVLGSFTPTADMTVERLAHTVTTVNSGAAVIIGGQDGGLDPLDSIEYFPFANSAPVVSNVSGSAGLAVPVSFDLTDAEGDKAFCIVQVSTDGGNTFQFATLTDYSRTVNLFPGTNTVTWDAAADGVSAGQSATLRIIPVGGVIGTPVDATVNVTVSATD